MKYKKIIIDSILNILSAALPLLVLQFFAFPIIAQELGGNKYGEIVTLISLFTIVAFPLGNVLNNVRLLTDRIYIKENFKGDFNPFLIIFSIFGGLVITIAITFIDLNLDLLHIFSLIIITVLTILKEYWIVSFRLVLNFKGILLNNLYMSLGYFIGSLIFMMYNYWQIIYIIGVLFSLVYILQNSKLHKEPYRFTPLYSKTANKSLILYLANLIKNLLVHADKLILFPLLGPGSVAIYYTATVIGKVVSMMVNPVNSVILSYLVKVDNISNKKFIKLFGLITLVGISSYFITIFVSPYFLRTFYNEWADLSLELIYITTATAVINMLTTVINPFNLRFNKTIWQVYMSLLHFIVYISSIFYFYPGHGLKGFSIGVFVASLFKFILQISVFLINNNKKCSE